jgi:iron complex outermembrane receptor protein
MGSNTWGMRRALRAGCILAVGSFGVIVSMAAAANAAAADGPVSETQNANAAPAKAGTGLQEIVVTARRREELLQDVPVAVTVYTAESLRQLDATNIKDTLGVTPGLYLEGNSTFSPNEDFEQLVIRGIGANSQLEPSVGTFVNGVYVPAEMFDIGFLDVQHIEVLKGPQGALFGRNTEAGAVNIVLTKPDDTFHARVSESYDNFNTSETDAMVTGPVVGNTLFASFAAKLMQSDYFVRQTGTAQVPPDPYFPGQNLIQEYDPRYNPIHSADGQRDDAFRAALRYVPQDDLELNFSVHGSRFRGVSQAPGPLDGCNCYTVDDDEAFENIKDTYGAELGITKKYSLAQLTVTLGYESVKSDMPFDHDGSTILAGNYDNYYRSQTVFSGEVRLNSVTDSPLQWQAGLYGFHDHDFTDRFYIWSNLGEPGYLNVYSGLWNLQHTNISRPGAAAYGQLSFDFSPALQVAVGGRYSWERANDSQLVAFIIPANGVVLSPIPSTDYGWKDFYTPIQSSASWSNFSPQAELRYKWGSDFMTYVNVAEGFKAGSYQIAPVATTDVYPISPEKTINYELGTKGDWLDHRLSLDADIFYIKLKDQQLQSVALLNGLITSTINNASSSHSQGAELSLSARPTEHLSLSGNVAYTHAQFDKYFDLGASGTIVDRSGQLEPTTPAWTGFLGAAYTIPLQRYELELSANDRYVGRTYVGGGTGPSDPILGLPEWSQLNVAAALKMDAWSVRLLVDNVTDRYIILNKYVPFMTPNNYLIRDIVAAPRRYGIQVSYQY